jgi:LPXTG-site transpeptidase (sortase) family protein
MQVLRTNPRPRRLVRKPSKLVLKQLPWRESGAAAEAGFLAQVPKRLLLSCILFALGTGLCTYVVASYAWMYGEQIKLLREWKKQNASSKADGTLVKLSIPRIHLRAVVLEDTSKQSLLLGPAHVSGTAEPGTAGNVVLAGHRDTFFRHVHSLRYGDDIYILKGGNQAHYQVTSKKVVEPTELSVLRSTPNGQLTLITCYPPHAIGPAPQRLIIVAKLIKGT